MRNTPRSFLTAILLTLVAGFALSQEAAAPPPPLAPEVAAPVAELPQLPVVNAPSAANPNAPAVDPAVTIDPSVLAVPPARVETVQAPGPEKPVVTADTRRVARESWTKPLAKPSVEATGSFQPVTGESLNPPDASANTAAARSEAPAPAAAKSVIPESRTASGSRATMILGEWVLAGVLLVALFGVIQLLRHRGIRPRSPVIEIPVPDTKLNPAPVTRM